MVIPRRLTERFDPIVRAPQIRRAALSILVCVASFIASNHASARDYAPHDVGDWTVAPSKDGKGCFLNREYDRSGGTTLLLGLDADGANRLSVLNANWSISPGIGSKKLADLGPAEKTTPAGRFLARFGIPIAGERILWADYATSVDPVGRGGFSSSRSRRSLPMTRTRV
jgi:hypothetical protein